VSAASLKEAINLKEKIVNRINKLGNFIICLSFLIKLIIISLLIIRIRMDLRDIVKNKLLPNPNHFIRISKSKLILVQKKS
jgi:hypothetical protein